MSSGVESGGVIIAAAVAAPAAAIYAAGWTAWQAGKLIVHTMQTVDKTVEEAKKMREDSARRRMQAAADGRRQLIALCQSVMRELPSSGDASVVMAANNMKYELRRITEEELPASAEQLESMNALGLAQVNEILHRKNQLLKKHLRDITAYEGLSAADLMEDLNTAFKAAEINRTNAADVRAADPEVYERAQLQRQYHQISGKYAHLAAFIADITEHYGMTAENAHWFSRLLDVSETRLSDLASPLLSNEEMRSRLKVLEHELSRNDQLLATLRREKQKMDELYPIYKAVAADLCEPVYEMRHFKRAKALEEEMERLKPRAVLARNRAEIYRRLGKAGYMCYAWDQELRKQGYNVKSRTDIEALTGKKAVRVMHNGKALPFYQWTAEEASQIYEISPECQLQLIVHADGSTSMQTIYTGFTASDDRLAVEAQTAHCGKVAEIIRGLRENWFITYSSREAAPPEALMSAAQWRDLYINGWEPLEEQELSHRRREEEEARRSRQQQKKSGTMHMGGR